MTEALRDHPSFPVADRYERVCACGHGYDDHEARRSQLVCVEKSRGARCDCREFSCWDHPDNDCYVEDRP